MDSQPQIPEQIGRFRLIEELGAGATAIVYKAFDPEINRTLAIKLLRVEYATDAEYRYRFLQEAKAAGNLVHPNIVTIFDIGEVDEGPYIAMEYLEGKTLEEIMGVNERLPLRDTVVYGIQLAEALDYSHARGVVHRDVKPGNIIAPGGGQSIRITDFGIAHLDTPGKEHKTKLGTVLGTPQYMSPEQVEGLPIDGRSDLFSIGVVLYQAITGEKPFVSETLTSLLMKIVQSEPPPIGSKAPEAPQSLQMVVDKLLKKQPEQRFQTGHELAEALRSVLHEIDEKEELRNEAKILPLRIKWTLIMSTVVALAMILGSYFVYQKQVDTMTELTLDSGGALADFIAIESAESVLIKDWVAIETFVQEIQERQRISYLNILDHKMILRGSSSPEKIGTTLEQSPDMKVLRMKDDTFISEGSWQQKKVFDFKVPIKFQAKTIGEVQLGLSQAPLQAAADLTLYTMSGLLVAVVLIVVIVAYLLAAGITVPLKILRRALYHVRNENLSFRIKEERNDELGLLFHEYNRMVEAIVSNGEDVTALNLPEQSLQTGTLDAQTHPAMPAVESNSPAAEPDEVAPPKANDIPPPDPDEADEPTRVMWPRARHATPPNLADAPTMILPPEPNDPKSDADS